MFQQRLFKRRFQIRLMLFMLWLAPGIYATAAHEWADSSKCLVICDTLLHRSYYISAEILPEFPGGTGALIAYIRKNFNVPENSPQGCISLKAEFIVEINGRLTFLNASSRQEKKELLQELKRMAQNMPAWKPANCDKQPVPCKIFFPVYLEIE